MITSPQQAGFRSGVVRNAFQQRRDQSIVALRAMGRTVAEIAKRLKITERAVYMALRRTQPAQQVISEELAKEAVDSSLILTRLSEMFNADFGDIIEPREIENPEIPGQWVANPRADAYRPIHEWPAIWRKMLSGAEVKELFEHSRDGVGASWDKIGELVKIKFVDPLKLLELAMKHRDVDAMVKQSGDMNIVIVTPEQQRQARLERAQQRLSEAIDVTPEKDG